MQPSSWPQKAKPLLIWCGEAGVRVYAAAHCHASPENALKQARIALDKKESLRSAGRIFRLMFDEDQIGAKTLDEIRGAEGFRVKTLYEKISNDFSVLWTGRDVTKNNNRLNQSISYANACLYGIAEAAILSLGLNPGIGILHRGDPRSFVFDVADTIKFKTVVPAAFQIFDQPGEISSITRRKCRDVFREHKVMERLVENIEKIISEN